MNKTLLQIEEPQDYFTGIGNLNIPTPTHVLLFLRKTKARLQQNTHQNRSHHRCAAKKASVAVRITFAKRMRFGRFCFL